MADNVMDVNLKFKRETFAEKFFTIVIYSILLVLLAIFLYPFIIILSESMSNGAEVLQGNVSLLPKGFNLIAYEMIFSGKKFWVAFANTVYYIVAGVALNLVLCSMIAFALSKKHMMFRSGISLYLAFTMLFGGGMVPTYNLVQSLGLLDSRWSVILASTSLGGGLCGVMYIIMMRTFYQGIPESYDESARMDGAGDIRIMLGIYMPLSKPMLATLGLMLTCTIWNSYFDALLFLSDSNKYPVQLILRNFFVDNSGSSNGVNIDLTGIYNQTIFGKTSMTQFEVQAVLQPAVIIITILPIVALFLSVQKYFIKGMVIGGIKG